MGRVVPELCAFVQCVYGETQIRQVRDVLVPALRRSTRLPLTILTTNYDGNSTHRVPDLEFSGGRLLDVSNDSGRVCGFAENHNRLFAFMSGEAFVCINPDCVPFPDSIDTLIARRMRYVDGHCAIVEGRQWPFEHPKEYDQVSLETPWASAAFALIDSRFYRTVGGMDPIYFLYCEDVDLSWRAWLTGWKVIYEPEATSAHFTNGPFGRRDLVSNERYFSLRNFMILSRKFFGKEGEERAIKMLRKHPDRELAVLVIDEYLNVYSSRLDSPVSMGVHPKVKITGVNLFHELGCR